jgi:hypothetical protein
MINEIFHKKYYGILMYVRGSSMTLDLDYNYLMVHIYTNFRIILEI